MIFNKLVFLIIINYISCHIFYNQINPRTKGRYTMTEYFANIEAVNETKFSCPPHGTAKFTENESTLHIEHWANFHGF